METIEKIDIAKMKADIKAMVEKQKFYKNQRKTEKLVGERKMSPSDATYEHQENRKDLRIMYAAYGLVRGKSFPQIENTKYPEVIHPLKNHPFPLRIDRVINKYKNTGRSRSSGRKLNKLGGSLPFFLHLILKLCNFTKNNFILILNRCKKMIN